VAGAGRVVAHTYPAAGLYTAVVTASNRVSLATATTIVAVLPPGWKVYLPLVFRR
jgi:hypothetical protein